MDEIEGLLNRGHQVATREQLVELIGRVRLDTQIRSGGLLRVFPRTYALPWDVDLPEVRRHAALASVGGQVALSHLSALTAWDLPAPEDGPLHVTAYQPRHPRGVAGELVVHRTLLPLNPVWISDLPVVSAEVALVTSWPLLAGDSQRAPIIEASRRRLIRPDVLSRCVESMHWIRGRGQLRDLAGLVLSGCQSELELWGYLQVFDADGLRHGTRQRTICFGGKEFRIDLAYEDVRLAVEMDGRAYHASPEQWERDIQRDLAGDGGMADNSSVAPPPTYRHRRLPPRCPQCDRRAQPTSKLTELGPVAARHAELVAARRPRCT
jgi:hypothetical protein